MYRLYKYCLETLKRWFGRKNYEIENRIVDRCLMYDMSDLLQDDYESWVSIFDRLEISFRPNSWRFESPKLFLRDWRVRNKLTYGSIYNEAKWK